jgi:hypothetical protein
VSQYHGRLDPAKAPYDRIDEFLGLTQRIISGVEELDRSAEYLGRPAGLVTPDRLDLVELLAVTPGFGRLAALAVAQAQYGHAGAARSSQGHGASRPPDEIPGVRADRQERIAECLVARLHLFFPSAVPSSGSYWLPARLSTIREGLGAVESRGSIRPIKGQQDC